VPRNLLLRFASDEIDETPQLASTLQSSGAHACVLLCEICCAAALCCSLCTLCFTQPPAVVRGSTATALLAPPLRPPSAAFAAATSHTPYPHCTTLLPPALQL
jgi:hypothetical protein